jgi:mono/diheme cytochrome c family protein
MTAFAAPRSRSLRGRRAVETPGARVALALVATVALVAPVLAEDASSANAAMSRGWEFIEQGGADLFSNICAACHQPNAKGAVGAAAYPPLAADNRLVSADFVLTVLFGGLRSMPPVGRMMSDEQVADVINYVRTHFGNSYAGAISAADVAAARRRATTTP